MGLSGPHYVQIHSDLVDWDFTGGYQRISDRWFPDEVRVWLYERGQRPSIVLFWELEEIRWDNGVEEEVYYPTYYVHFPDPDEAFEFKMRWG